VGTAVADADIVVINYDVLGRHLAELTTRKFAGIVFDESHYAKNYKARRTAHCRELAQGIRRALLTGPRS